MPAHPRRYEYRMRRASRGRWSATEDELAGLRFPGAAELVGHLDFLVRRPYLFWRDRLLPIVTLARDGDRPSPLDSIERRLLREDQAVLPYARVGGLGTGPRGDLLALLDLIGSATAQLNERRGRGPRLRFPLYRLGYWLTALEVPAGPDAHNRYDLVRQLLEVHFVKSVRLPVDRAQFEAIAAEVSGWWALLGLGVAPARRWVMEHLWYPPKWFANYPLGSGDGGTGFLGRAAGMRAAGEEAVARMVVAAFLHDLRRAYRRRRPAYPMLLVESADDAAAWLVALIAECRDVETPPRRRGRLAVHWDPLLVVESRPWQEGDAAVGWLRPGDAQAAFPQWLRGWGRSDEARRWRMRLRIPPGPASEDSIDRLRKEGLPTVRRRTTLWVAGLLLVAATAVGVTFNERRCEPWWSPRLSTTMTLVQDGRQQCVGLSRDSRPFTPDGEMAKVYGVIEVQNRRVTRDAGKTGRYVSVVYLSTLTAESDDLEGQRSTIEELRGIAVAQKKSSTPMRILFANIGSDLTRAAQTAREIASAADRERIVAVVGLGISHRGARQARDLLIAEGIPVAGTLVSASDLATPADGYHQVGPPNARLAEVAAEQLRAMAGNRSRNERPRVHITYLEDPDDTYSKDLADKVAAELKDRFQTDSAPYAMQLPATDPRSAMAVGQAACGYDLAFFAGRDASFGEYLTGLRGCRTQVLAGDAVIRFILDGKLGLDHPGRTIRYLAMASMLSWRATCGEGTDPRGFLGEYEASFGVSDADPATCNRLNDGQAMMAFDAVDLVARASVGLPTGRWGEPYWWGHPWGEIVTNSGQETTRRWRRQVASQLDLLGWKGAPGLTGWLSYTAPNPFPVKKLTLVIEATAGKGTTRTVLVRRSGR
ncbi:hypothetical protein GCM10010124_41090 [Pilimelia terevasa]|uniref:Uncharacterized protein n=1 Tax=Pilimelia terevasa TaxID=53372 RepID=A0A8J3BUG7_9ACTN|nr:ABC transporter substrate-binding protein [Pilimelia terevasa]GGK44022.1 hypothetical protein GCM10010124_41090 [Pilimelia terevasa]